MLDDSSWVYVAVSVVNGSTVRTGWVTRVRAPARDALAVVFGVLAVVGVVLVPSDHVLT